MVRVILLYMALAADVALAFPDLFRHGYSSCQSCHVSPTGGGALTSYGRVEAGELLSAYGSEKAANYAISRVPPWLNFGGDTRYLNISSESYNAKYHRHFVMQSDFELVVTPVPGFSVGGTVGYYNFNYPEKNYKKIELEQRRSYAMLNLGKYVIVRVGKFFPAYGIHFPDHTLATRKYLGFNEGEESYNAEFSVRSKWGDLYLTGVNGREGSVRASEKSGYGWKADGGESGVIGRLTSAPYFKTQLVASFKRTLNRNQKEITTAGGLAFYFSPLSFLYTLAEYDFLMKTGKKTDHVWVVRQGLELMKGVNLYVNYEGKRQDFSGWRWGGNIYPYPHFELGGEYQRNISEKGVKTEAFVFLTHFYF